MTDADSGDSLAGSRSFLALPPGPSHDEYVEEQSASRSGKLWWMGFGGVTAADSECFWMLDWT